MSDFTPRDALAEVLDGDQSEYRKAAEAAKRAGLPESADPRHAPMRIISNMGIPFIDCSCGVDHYVQTSAWLETHWEGTQAEGLAAIQDVIDRQHETGEVTP